MKIFLFLGSCRGYVVLTKLIETKQKICGILCLIDDPHEEQYHLKIRILANEQQIPIFFSNQIKPKGYATILQQVKPDIAFAIGWRYLITKDAYSIPLKGTLIIHDSLLPAYRGFAPMNWAIINGEQTTGATLFYIADGIDSGPIVDQLTVDILLEDTVGTVNEKMVKLYETIIVKNLPSLINGTAKAIPQNELLASYTCKRTPYDGKINWQHSAMQIYNLIRGLTHPFPGAYTILRGKTMFVWAAELLKYTNHYVGIIPGRIIGKCSCGIEVLTGNGTLRLKRVH